MENSILLVALVWDGNKLVLPVERARLNKPITPGRAGGTCQRLQKPISFEGESRRNEVFHRIGDHRVSEERGERYHECEGD